LNKALTIITYLLIFTAFLYALISYNPLANNKAATTSYIGESDSPEKVKVTTSTALGFENVSRVVFRGLVLFVEVADTDEERGKGLSDREMLKEGWGMLFVFERPGRYSFWMYRMHFPLDIIWLDSDGYVVYVVEDAPPCSMDGPCRTYDPTSEAKYVLEVNAGWVERVGLKIGDRMEVYLDGLSQLSQTSQAQSSG